MTHSKRKLYALICAVVFCLMIGLLASCSGCDENGPTPDPGDYGLDNVYFMTENGNEYLLTITGDSFMLSGFNGDQTGKITYDSESGAITFVFKDDSSTTATASIEDGVLKLVYNGNTYRMLLRASYTVSFEVDGGSAVPAQSVLNGQNAQKPQDPTKDGYAFIGWYTDATYATPFDFANVAITQNVTVYARFEKLETGRSEVTATLVCDGSLFDPIQTINGVLYNLPTPTKEGSTFVGWWMSDYESGDKLTAQYTGQQLKQDTKLFAVFAQAGTPLVSVGDSKITWTSVGPTKTYVLTIKKGDETVVNANVGAPEYEYSFKDQPAGEYTVTVSCDGKSSTVYRKNKSLDRVSNFRVVSSGVLAFNPVENAQEYIITVVCGNPNHNHTEVSNGLSTTYVFSSCEMPEDGISFVVTAKASGYLDSVSTFKYALALDKVTGVTLNGSLLTWDPVDNAAAYYVAVSSDGNTYVTSYVSGGTSFSLAGYGAGKLYVQVTPVTDGYYSAPAESVTVDKVSIAAPTGITLSGKTLKWNAVDGATSYTVTVNGKSYDVSANEFTLSADNALVTGTIDYSVTVRANGSTEAANSAYSDTVVVKYGSIGSVSYSSGKVVWDPVVGAEKYVIKVGTRQYNVNGDKNSLAVVFTEAGATTVSVAFIDENGDQSVWSSTTVNVYAVELDSRGGKGVSTLYLAYGDSIELPETTRDGYEFAGWFTSPAGQSGGKQYTSTVFEGTGDTVLYAGWESKKYTVTLVPGEGATVSDTSVKVTYGLYNNLPVPTHEVSTKLFVGWYTEANGSGIRYTSETGEAVLRWNSADDVTLYAYFAEVLSFESISDGKAYSVSKGQYGLGSLTSITIPATYNGLPVTTIEAAGFKSCTGLVKINIPNTIQNIEIGTEGVDGSASAFSGCSKLEEINVYEVEGAVDVLYYSTDGVLYYNNPYTGKEIKAVPQAKTGVFTIEEGTEVIPAGALQKAKFTEIYVPYTVKEVAASAFRSCSNLTKIAFLATPEGVETEPNLQLADKAIYSCSYLTEIIFPSRMKNFTADTIYSCSKLASVDVVGNTGDYSAVAIGGGQKVICDSKCTTIVYCPKGIEGQLTITDTRITTIGEGAFKSCTKLTSAVIPGHVTTIGKEAFKSCTGLTSVDLTEDGNGLAISESAFYGCSGLTSLTLPARLYKLEAHAFGGTSKLVEVTVNSSGSESVPLDFAEKAFGSTAATSAYYVTTVKIGEKVPAFTLTAVFGQKIATVEVDAKNENYSSIDGVLFNKDATSIIFFPAERAGEYVIPDTVTEIGDNIFNGRKYLTKVTIGKNVKTVGAYAFKGCSGLTEIVFAAGGTDSLEIDTYAFQTCNALTSLELPERLVSIGDYAFASCSKIKTLVLPTTLKSIGSCAFQACHALETVNLPASIEVLKKTDAGQFNVFETCSALANITVDAANEHFMAVDNVLYAKTATADGNAVATELLFCPRKKAGSTTVKVPGTVSSVAANAFYYNSTVKEIEFADLEGDNASLTIGTNAFYYCTNLHTITLPEGLSTIAKEMFSGCTYITRIVIPSTVATIENKAFYGCSSLSELVFTPTKEGATPVELTITDATGHLTSPFYNCRNLKKIEFPERLVYIGNYCGGGENYSYSSGPSVQYYCYFEEIYLPSTLQHIGKYAFAYAPNLTKVVFADNSSLEDATSGKTNVPAIGNYAFAYSSSLTSFKLPTVAEGSSYSLGNYVFYHSAIESIEIPASVKAIGSYAFGYCSSLKTVTFAEGAAPEFSGDDIFVSSALTSITLPDGIKSIPGYTFQNCKKLTSIVIPSSVTSIGTSAFSGCSKLTKVTFATYEKDGKDYSKVAEIKLNAFANTAITSFAFPTLEGGNKLTLGNTLFSGCVKLNSVRLSASVADITDVFNKCYSIKTFSIDEGNANFSMKPGDPVLYNKDQTAYRYIVGLLEGEHVVPEGVTEISSYTFSGQIGITKLVLPKTVQEIGEYAFSECTALETVVFEHSADAPSQLNLKKVGQRLFNGCTALKNVTLPTNMTEIPNYMFYGCSSLESITLHEGITSIGDYAFASTGLTSVTIPTTVKSIGADAFSGASTTDRGKLSELIFAKDSAGNTALTTINHTAFKFQSLVSVEIPKSVTKIYANAFSYNEPLVSFTFEKGTTIEYLPAYMLQYCTSLESFVVPASVKEFSYYSSATSKTLSASSSIFAYCSSLKSVTFEEGSQISFLGTTTFAHSGLESFVVPETVTHFSTSNNGKKAAHGITNKMFDSCTSLKSITLGSKTTYLASYMFTGCTALETVDVPDTVTVIGSYCFEKCTSLKTINFGDDSQLKNVGQYCFSKSGIESIVFPKGVTALGYFSGSGVTTPAATVSSSSYQFNECANLKSVEFKGAVTALGAYVFYKCTALESIELPAKTTVIGNRCFQYCSSLKSVTLNSTGALQIGTYAFADSGLTEITIPKGTKSVGTYVFSNCTDLEKVTVADGTQALTLDKYCFQKCTSLKSIDLPGRVTAISDYTFYGCESLESVTLNKVKTIGNGAFSGCYALKSVILPDTVTTINGSAFLNCSSLKSITIPEKCTSIGSNVFAGCRNLLFFSVHPDNKKYEVQSGALIEKGNVNKIIALPAAATDGVLEIPEGTVLGAYALNGLHNLTAVVLPDGITEIPDYAFASADIETLVIPESVTTIGANAFADAKIKYIHIPAAVTTIGNYAFQNCENLTTVTFAENSELKYLGNYAFSGSGITEITIPAGVTCLGNNKGVYSKYLATYTFMGCESLTSVTFLGELDSIGSYAFKNCTALKSFKIPETVTVIGWYAFEGAGLESIEIPAGVRAFYFSSSGEISTSSSNTFKNCTSLKTVVLHEGLEYINGSTFVGCTALESIVIPSTVTKIDSYAFDGCESLKSVTFAKDAVITAFGNYAFRNTGLETIEIPEEVNSLGTYLFYGSALKSVKFLGNSIQKLDSNTFANCESLTSFVIPSTVTTIGASCFAGSGLKSVTIPAAVTSWSTSAFKDCLKLETVVFEEGCTTVYGSMFAGCTNLKSVKLAGTIDTIGSSAFADCTSLKELVIPKSVYSMSYAFTGWTAEQTVKFEISESDSKIWPSSGTSAWNKNCEAKFVWDYTESGSESAD